MKINKDQIDMNAHENHENYEKSQFIVGLLQGEKLEILVDGIKIKEYIAKHSNCHVNMTIQDMSEKREPTELERLQAEKARLEFLIAKEQTK